MIERIKSYLKDRLKKLEDLKNERRWVTSELDGEERWWTTAELGDMVCCKQTLEFIDSLQEEPVSDETMTIRKEWFEHCKKSWYNEGYIDGKHNRKSQFEESVPEEVDEDESK